MNCEMLPDLFDRDAIADCQDWYERQISSEGVLMLGAWQGEDLVASLHASIRSVDQIAHIRARKVAYVGNLVVAKAFRRQGIATALMTAVNDWAKTKEAESIELGVYLFNESAAALYEKLGFRSVRSILDRSVGYS